MIAGWLIALIVLFFAWVLCAAAAKAEPKLPKILNLKLEISDSPAEENGRVRRRDREKIIRTLSAYERTEAPAADVGKAA